MRDFACALASAKSSSYLLTSLCAFASSSSVDLDSRLSFDCNATSCSESSLRALSAVLNSDFVSFNSPVTRSMDSSNFSILDSFLSPSFSNDVIFFSNTAFSFSNSAQFVFKDASNSTACSLKVCNSAISAFNPSNFLSACLED